MAPNTNGLKQRKNHVGKSSQMPLKETYMPMFEEPARRRSIYEWLRGKARDDDIGPDRWRIDDKLYDLTSFASIHPGGKTWIELTKGTDITEAFYVAHYDLSKIDKLLEKYRVGSCVDKKRRSMYTFEKDGFYLTLKRRAAKILKQVGTGPTTKMLLLQDGLLISFVLLFILAAMKASLPLTLLAGLLLGMSSASSHNFFHQKDNFRCYYLDFSVFNSTDWRILHFLSHHLFSNTFNDFEAQSIYPLVDWNSYAEKSKAHKYFSIFYYNLVFLTAAPLSYLNKWWQILSLDCKFMPMDLTPIIELLIFYGISGLDFWSCFWYNVVMHCICGYWIAFTTLSATHHHPSNYHAGDFLHPDRDWGVQQLDSQGEVRKSSSLFLIATTFGDHLLHHFFPTVDHSKLKHLYPALEETLHEFRLSYEFEGFWKMMKGMHSQMRKGEPLDHKQRMMLRGDRSF